MLVTVNRYDYSGLSGEQPSVKVIEVDARSVNLLGTPDPDLEAGAGTLTTVYMDDGETWVTDARGREAILAGGTDGLRREEFFSRD